MLCAMTKRVLILGLRPDLVAELERALDGLGATIAGGSTLEDLRARFAEGDFDHVILGGGLDVETRAAAVREIFSLSDRATVHMKDQRSGPEGFAPFVTAVLSGLAGYDPQLSPRAILRARR